MRTATRAKTKRPTTREANHSRAALGTIHLAVETVADSVRHLKSLQGHVLQGHRAAVRALQMARHHPLRESDQSLVEDGVSQLSSRMDWSEAIHMQTQREHLERPLTNTESSMVRHLASSAVQLACGTLDISELLDAWYGELVLIAVATARTALPAVTVEAHRRRAARLLGRLELLCGDERIAWAFTEGSRRPSPVGRTLH
jgi:hypothetical protein